MRFVTVVALLVIASIAQPTVPSTSATLTPTCTITPSPRSISVTASPSMSPVSISSTRSASATPGSATPTATVTTSPFASLTGRWCERDPCIVGSCITGSRCCNGFCINNAYVPATISIGGACTSGSGYSTSCTLCGPGLSCDTTTSRCVLFGLGYGCSGTCSTSADCATGLSCTTTSKCGFTRLGVGAACNNAATCFSGLTCTDGICTAIPHMGSCSQFNEPYDPSLSITAVRDYFMLDGGCVNTAYCANSVCTPKKATGAACTTPNECASGICNSLFCAAAKSIANQQACTSNNACATGLFCGGGACQPLVGQGLRCTQSFVLPYTPATQGWCQSGLVCSNYDNSRPQCMPSNVPVGGVCYNSDQCSSASHLGCTPDTPQSGTMWARGVPGKCSGSSYGLPCIPGNNTWCANSDGGQSNSCGTCTNPDGSAPGTWVCNPAPTTSPCLSLLTAANNAIWSAGYYQASNPIFAATAVGGMEAPVAYVCCTMCTNGAPSATQAAINLAAAVLGRSLNCVTGTAGPALTGTVSQNVCVGTASVGQTVSVPFSTMFQSCAATPAPSDSFPPLPANPGLIIGLVVGFVVLAVLSFVCACCWCKRRRRWIWSTTQYTVIQESIVKESFGPSPPYNDRYFGAAQAKRPPSPMSVPLPTLTPTVSFAPSAPPDQLVPARSPTAPSAYASVVLPASAVPQLPAGHPGSAYAPVAVLANAPSAAPPHETVSMGVISDVAGASAPVPVAYQATIPIAPAAAYAPVPAPLPVAATSPAGAPASAYGPVHAVLTQARAAPAPAPAPSTPPAASRRHLSIQPPELVIGDLIGAGAYGVVHKGTWRGAAVAVKMLRMDNLTAAAIAQFEAEADVIGRLRPHPNVVQFLGLCEKGDALCIVSSFVPGGSLLALTQSSAPVSGREKLSLAEGIAAGLLHLHREGIVHRDLAARNILLGRAGDGSIVPLITDFGMSRETRGAAGRTASDIGPVKWMAPESVLSRQYSAKSDVWAFGVLLFELFARAEPYGDMTPLEIVIGVTRGGLVLPLPEDGSVPPDVAALIRSCMQWNTADRPTLDDVHSRLCVMRGV